MVKKGKTNLKYTKNIGTLSIIFNKTAININQYLNELEPLIIPHLMKGSIKIQLVINVLMYTPLVFDARNYITIIDHYINY